MVVVHIIEAFGGGIIDFVHSLTKGIDKHEHIVIRSSRQDDDIKLDFSHVKFIDWPDAQREISIRKDVKATFALYKILQNIKYDALHLHSSKAGIIGRIIIPILGRKKPVIFSPNGISFAKTDIGKIKKKFYIIVEKISSRAGGTIVSVSRSEANEFKKHNIKSYYINNGIEIKNSIKYRNENKKLIIGTVGRITFQKNPNFFNRLAKHFENKKEIEFLWIGDGELKSQLTSKNINITGWVSKTKAIKTLKTLDIYLSTALWEGLPFSVLDAMNFEKPLVLNNCIGNIDLVEQGKNGFIFDTFDEAVKIIDSLAIKKTYREQLGIFSKHILEKNFNVEDMCSQYEAVYKGDFSNLKYPS